MRGRRRTYLSLPPLQRAQSVHGPSGNEVGDGEGAVGGISLQAFSCFSSAAESMSFLSVRRSICVLCPFFISCSFECRRATMNVHDLKTKVWGRLGGEVGGA